MLVVEHFALLVRLGVLALAHFLEIVDHLFLDLHPLGGAVEMLGVDEEGPPP